MKAKLYGIYAYYDVRGNYTGINKLMDNAMAFSSNMNQIRGKWVLVLKSAIKDDLYELYKNDLHIPKYNKEVSDEYIQMCEDDVMCDGCGISFNYSIEGGSTDEVSKKHWCEDCTNF